MIFVMIGIGSTVRRRLLPFPLCRSLKSDVRNRRMTALNYVVSMVFFLEFNILRGTHKNKRYRLWKDATCFGSVIPFMGL